MLTAAIAVYCGLGKHTAALPPTALTTYLKIAYVEQLMYTTGMSLIKYSILLFYGRIFPLRTYHIQLWVIAVIVAAWQIATTLTYMFQCIPIHKAWDYMDSGGSCLNLNMQLLSNAIPNIVTDLLILGTPQVLVWKLQLPRIQRIALVGVFLSGGLCV